MMSMKGDGKPVSFIEDCAVPLEHLAEYTERLTPRLRRSTARAAPGMRTPRSARCTCGRCLDMRRDGAEKMRRDRRGGMRLWSKQYKGAYSGEHGDGLVRSEWIAPFFYGPRV